MSKLICKKCDSFDGTCCISVFAFPYDIECSDTHCEYFREKQKPTVFDRITQSPEVLAEKLVEDTMDGTMFYSIITREDYCTKERAIAATVEKLKEVVE